MTLKIRPNAIEQDCGPFTFPGVRLPNDGLHILDTDASHHLIIKPGSNLSADRELTIVTGDAARTLTLSGNPTLSDWFDQAVKQASSPTFAALTITNNIIVGGTVDGVNVSALPALIAANTTVAEVEAVIDAELVDGESIDLAIDSLIATHDAISDAHHSRYTDGEVESVITAELVDGQSIDLAIDSLISTHAGDDDIHHAKYTDAEALAQAQTRIQDTAYPTGWDADTTHAPSQNAVYDKINAMDTLIAANTTVTEVEAVITAELVNGQSIDLAIDSLILTHKNIAGAHHSRYADSEVEDVITAEIVGGQSIDNAIDALISTHVGLSDPHTGYVLESLADAANDFLVASGANTWVRKTLAQTGAILEGDMNHDNLQGFASGEHFTEASISHANITAGTGSDHSHVVLNTTHRTSTGTNHTYINQDVRSTANPTFGSLTITNNIVVGGTVDGVDVAALKTDVDGFPDRLKNLAATEIIELEAIGATTISATQWGYLGVFNQNLRTTDSPTFAGANLNGAVTINESGADVDFRVETDLGTHTLFVNGGDNRVELSRYLPAGTFTTPQSSMFLTTRKGAATMADGVGPKLLLNVENNSAVLQYSGGVATSHDFTNSRSAIIFQHKSGAGDTYAEAEAFYADYLHARVSNPFFIKETATSVADIAGYGQLWVKSDTPNTLYFTDDDGTDTQLGTGGGYTEGARVYNDANISIANATLTALTFNSERYDTDAIHDTGSNTSRLTCVTAGKYLIAGSCTWDANQLGNRGVLIELNGTGVYISRDTRDIDSATYHAFAVATVYDLAVDDYLELIAHQTSGGALNILSVGNDSPEFMMQRIG